MITGFGDGQFYCFTYFYAPWKDGEWYFRIYI
jgi:hypothetical protein